jgi:hypothetical protein
MKKLCFLLLMSWLVMEVTAQNVVYSNLKGLLACEGDTVTSLKVEKRTKNHIKAEAAMASPNLPPSITSIVASLPAATEPRGMALK